MQQTDPAVLKDLSDRIDAYAAAKVSQNEALVRFSIEQLQAFLNGYVITPATETAAAAPEAAAATTVAG